MDTIEYAEATKGFLNRGCSSYSKVVEWINGLDVNVTYCRIKSVGNWFLGEVYYG